MWQIISTIRAGRVLMNESLKIIQVVTRNLSYCSTRGHHLNFFPRKRRVGFLNILLLISNINDILDIILLCWAGETKMKHIGDILRHWKTLDLDLFICFISLNLERALDSQSDASSTTAEVIRAARQKVIHLMTRFTGVGSFSYSFLGGLNSQESVPYFFIKSYCFQCFGFTLGILLF